MRTSNLRVIVFCVAASVVAVMLGARYLALERLQHRWASQYVERLADMPPERAVQLVRTLAASSEPWLPVMVGALCDDRPSVRAAASAELKIMVERWAEMPVVDCSARAEGLTTILAKKAPLMPLDSRAAAQGIARTILGWPLDGSASDIARVIADCESVLQLPCEEPAEIRIAAARTEPTLLVAPSASGSDE
jgi:hypothetical protein